MATRDENFHYTRKHASRCARAASTVCSVCHAHIDARGYGHSVVPVPGDEYNGAVQAKIDGGMGVADAMGATPTERACPADRFR
jgi:hypothetical protein